MERPDLGGGGGSKLPIPRAFFFFFLLDVGTRLIIGLVLY